MLDEQLPGCLKNIRNHYYGHLKLYVIEKKDYEDLIQNFKILLQRLIEMTFLSDADKSKLKIEFKKKQTNDIPDNDLKVYHEFIINLIHERKQDFNSVKVLIEQFTKDCLDKEEEKCLLLENIENLFEQINANYQTNQLAVQQEMLKLFEKTRIFEQYFEDIKNKQLEMHSHLLEVKQTTNKPLSGVFELKAQQLEMHSVIKAKFSMPASSLPEWTQIFIGSSVVS